MNPNRYEDIVLNGSAETIPIRLAKELMRKGNLCLWQYQSFSNHIHLPTRLHDDWFSGMKISRTWEDSLSEHFPDLRFVIREDPFETITWYQATPGAPIEDETEYKDYMVPVTLSIRLDEGGLGDALKQALDATKQITTREGSNGPCEKCGQSNGFTDPVQHPEHRGIRTVICRGCGAQLIHSTRSVRYKVGF